MKRLWIFALLSALVLGGLPATSLARGGHGGWGGGGWGGGWYRGYGGYGGGFGYYGRGWGVGVGFGYPGWGYGGYGSYGYPYYSYPYYGGGYYYSQPYDYNYSAAPALAASTSYYTPQPAPANGEYQNRNSVNLEVRVPPNAQMWVEGQQIPGTGEVRHFYSPPLRPGQTYTYHIRARWTDPSGQVIDRAKDIDVQAGARTGVDLTRS